MAIDTGGTFTRPVMGELYEPGPLRATRPAGELDLGPARPEGGTGRGPDFGDALMGAIEQAAQLERDSTDMAVKFAEGDPTVGIHEVVIAGEKAGIAVRYATTLKNKLIDAYRELMNTQV